MGIPKEGIAVTYIEGLVTISENLSRIADAFERIADTLEASARPPAPAKPAIHLSFQPPEGADQLEIDAWGRAVESVIERANR